MFIKSLRIQGFKSLADVTLDDLSTINVFHGLNDAGKSNLLEALNLFYQILPLALQAEGITYFPRDELEPYCVERIFRLHEGKRATVIEWHACLRPIAEQSTVSLTLRLRKTDRTDPNEFRDDLALELIWPQGHPDESLLALLSEPEAGFNLLPAARWLHVEPVGSSITIQGMSRARHLSVTAENLKQALFSTAWNLNLERRARYREIAALLEKHFGLAGLETAQDAGEYVVGFQRSGEILRLEDLGSGVQQLVLLLGQMLLNPARSVGVEEPEMNLSPQWQKQLMAALHDLVSAGPGGLDQIFITSHSPEFEFQDYFYRVTYEEDATQVHRFLLSERQELFGPQPPLGELRGQRLNSQNQVMLYREVIEDLGLKYGDMVYFNKNAAGRWELQGEDDALAELREAFDELDNV